jgi:hypothetical protein
MRMSEEEYAEIMKRTGKPTEKPKRSKYGNVKTNGYDSKHEATRAAELQLLVKVGEVAGVLEQVPFLLPGDIKYIADFVILHWDGTFAVEDAKGCRTDVYRIKKKLMKAKGLEIVEV